MLFIYIYCVILIIHKKYLGSYIASTEHDINVRIGKYWSALNQLTNIWKSRLSKKFARKTY